MTANQTDVHQGHPIVLVDGVCHFCQGLTKWIIKRDPEGKYHFASLQSDVAKELLEKGNLSTDSMDTFVLIENGKYYTRSTAALRLAKGLKFPYPLLYVFIIVPKFIRNAVYNLVARNRYRWFGKDEACMLPTPEIKDRFL
ncbi:thiol-disulfide oxidoreductase DCC family protein [Paenibacillus polymyxa]|jgi:predicted DCC family thiol-disulfide oxidoreductase YuxK|uniref:thiol-disulfide oxidoreductase DCC family protein n=1 Tax=Paenibacillus TaxID=44249 RepID=UPI00088AF8CE|nr:MULTISPECIES: thiol-disulfide oxidoreductase DCC family protein [Paenibacillus]UOK64875.1 thiol-disulfide oxidoreductase DCC family protein [Paenibacillus sp. OVF10]MCL6660210.1 thiol-disulfide oxidoreductase DCC family protein [Paenibacillus amylolyticus]TDL64548.1 thiol-disulfide oxidoreductase DCC family protein [Paenibacillus amylolyticus]WJM09671.1 thiol-disulfide oxidoreductase DCC family protein [Paenibacillus sp. PK1-4R]SDC99077.1 Predicted thiol-disulfide oxidoreductase YuxK, DCC f